jgi:hypothetical protein
MLFLSLLMASGGGVPNKGGSVGLFLRIQAATVLLQTASKRSRSVSAGFPVQPKTGSNFWSKLN